MLKFLSGVNLWNISGLIGKYPDNDGSECTAARKYIGSVRCFMFLYYSIFGNLVRLAAFRLVEAGMEIKPGIESRFYFPCIVSFRETRTDHEPHRSYPRATVSK